MAKPVQQKNMPKPVQQKKSRSRVKQGEDFEVQHLAETTDLSPNQARELLRKHGNDWRKLDEEAKTFKAES